MSTDASIPASPQASQESIEVATIQQFVDNDAPRTPRSIRPAQSTPSFKLERKLPSLNSPISPNSQRHSLKSNHISISSLRSAAKDSVFDHRPTTEHTLSHQSSVDSLSYSGNQSQHPRTFQNPSDTLVLYDFPSAVLYKYPLHNSLTPKDYDQCPRVSDLLLQQSSMFVVARGRFQVYKIRGLDTGSEEHNMPSTVNTTNTSGSLAPSCNSVADPTNSASITTGSNGLKENEIKDTPPGGDFSKTLAYLRCGHMVHPILPKMRIWKISKNMYILPQPSPRKFWRLEIELPNDESQDKPEELDLEDLDEILKETCYYQSLYVPPLTPQKPIVKAEDQEIEQIPECFISPTRNKVTSRYQPDSSPTPTQTSKHPFIHPALRKRATIEQLTKHFEQQQKEHEGELERQFKKRAASLEFKKNHSPHLNESQESIYNETYGNENTVLGKHQDKDNLEDLAIASIDTNKPEYLALDLLEQTQQFKIKQHTHPQEPIEICKQPPYENISDTFLGNLNLNSKLGLQGLHHIQFGDETNDESVQVEAEVATLNLGTTEVCSVQDKEIQTDDFSLQDIKGISEKEYDRDQNISLMIGDPFGFPLDSPNGSNRSLAINTSVKYTPAIVTNDPSSPTLSSASSSSFASMRDQHQRSFYLQQGYPSPTVSELYHNNHSGFAGWSGYSSPVHSSSVSATSLNGSVTGSVVASAISSSSTLDHILDAFEDPETRLGGYVQNSNLNSSTSLNVSKDDISESSRRSSVNVAPTGVFDQLRSLGFGGLTNLSNIGSSLGSLNIGSLSNLGNLGSLRGFGSNNHQDSGIVLSGSTTSLDEQVMSDVDGPQSFTSPGSSVETLTETSFDGKKKSRKDRHSMPPLNSYIINHGKLVAPDSDYVEEGMSLHGSSLNRRISLASLSTANLSLSPDTYSSWPLPTSPTLPSRIGFIGPITTSLNKSPSPSRPRRRYSTSSTESEFESRTVLSPFFTSNHTLVNSDSNSNENQPRVGAMSKVKGLSATSTTEKHAQLFDYVKNDIKALQMKGVAIKRQIPQL